MFQPVKSSNQSYTSRVRECEYLRDVMEMCQMRMPKFRFLMVIALIKSLSHTYEGYQEVLDITQM